MKRRPPSRLRVLDEDELERVESIDQDTPLEDYPEWMREGFGGFEWMVAYVEAWAKFLVASEPVSVEMRHSLKPNAFAWRIATGIAHLRLLLRNSPEHEGLIIEALRVGYNCGEVKWRDLARAGLKAHVDRQTLSPKRREGQRKAALKKREAAKAWALRVDAHRRKTSDEMSPRDAVKSLLRQRLLKLSPHKRRLKVDSELKRYERGLHYLAEDAPTP